MGKKFSKRRKACTKRLLIIIFFLLQIVMYAEDVPLFSVSQSDNELLLNNTLTVELEFNKNAKDFIDKPNYYNLNVDISKTEDYEILYSNTAETLDGILVTIELQFKTIGNKTVIFNFSNANINIPVYVKVFPPNLSETSELNWSIFETDNISIPTTVKQGKSYVICLTGFFSTHFNNTVIDNIDCAVNENAILEKLNTELNSMNNYEKKIIALFKWTPVKTGFLELPAAKILFSNAESNKVHTVVSIKKIVEVVPSNYLKKDESNFVLNKSLIKKITETNEESKLSGQELINLQQKANKVQSLRKLLKNKIFAINTIAELKSLDKELGIEKSIPVFRKMQSIIFLILALICFFISVMVLLKKKHFTSVSIVVLILSTAIGVLCVSLWGYQFFNCPKKVGVVFSESSANVMIRMIPEDESVGKELAKVGESVIIINNKGDWYLVKKNNSATGWINKTELLLCY